eukprot:UN04008
MKKMKNYQIYYMLWFYMMNNNKLLLNQIKMIWVMMMKKFMKMIRIITLIQLVMLNLLNVLVVVSSINVLVHKIKLVGLMLKNQIINHSKIINNNKKRKNVIIMSIYIHTQQRQKELRKRPSTYEFDMYYLFIHSIMQDGGFFLFCSSFLSIILIHQSYDALSEVELFQFISFVSLSF